MSSGAVGEQRERSVTMACLLFLRILRCCHEPLILRWRAGCMRLRREMVLQGPERADPGSRGRRPQPPPVLLIQASPEVVEACLPRGDELLHGCLGTQLTAHHAVHHLPP